MQPASLAFALYERYAHRLLLVEREAVSLVQTLLELLCDADVLSGDARVLVWMREGFGERLQDTRCRQLQLHRSTPMRYTKHKCAE